MQFQALLFLRNLCTVTIEQEAEDSSDMLVSTYQITWCHISNTAVLMVISVRTSNIIVVSVANNLITPFLYYSQQEEHEKCTYQIQAFYAHLITDSLISKFRYNAALNTS